MKTLIIVCAVLLLAVPALALENMHGKLGQWWDQPRDWSRHERWISEPEYHRRFPVNERQYEIEDRVRRREFQAFLDQHFRVNGLPLYEVAPSGEINPVWGIGKRKGSFPLFRS